MKDNLIGRLIDRLGSDKSRAEDMEKPKGEAKKPEKKE